MNRRHQGFTLIELMLVASILGLLAAIALPKFGDAIRRSKEAAVLGHLGSLRSAITIYYADNEGLYPCEGIGCRHLDSLTVGRKYMDKIPSISIPGPANHRGSNYVGDDTYGIDGTSVLWFYPYGGKFGVLKIRCTHTDARGKIWSEH